MPNEPQKDMAYYEKQGGPSDWRRLMDAWMEGIQDPAADQIHDYHGFNMIHEVWEPKVKWFRPPMWKIFRWAYKIKRTLYTDCYPIGCSTTIPEDPSADEVEPGQYPKMVPTEDQVKPREPKMVFEFTAHRYPTPRSVTEMADKLLKEREKDLEEIMEQYKEEDK